MKKKHSKRPPRSWFRHCVAHARKTARNARKVCGALWYRKMTPKERAAAKRTHRD